MIQFVPKLGATQVILASNLHKVGGVVLWIYEGVDLGWGLKKEKGETIVHTMHRGDFYEKGVSLHLHTK